MRLVAWPLLLSLGSPWPTSAQQAPVVAPAHTSRSLVLRHATLLDGLDTLPQRDVAITIRDGWFASVVPDGRVLVSVSDSVIDVHGAWVVPGLIDAHAHVGLDGLASTNDNVRDARWALEGGATTFRSAGVSRYADVALGALARTGSPQLPRVLAAGYPLVPLVTGNWLRAFPAARPLVTPSVPADSVFRFVPGSPADSVFRLGPGPEWRLTGNPAAINAVVDVLAAHGVQWVKVFATGRAGGDPRMQFLTERDMRAAVRAARRHGLWVEAHAHGDAGIRAAVRAGVRTIEHGTYASDATLRLMRARGTCFVPTLTVWDEAATSPDAGARARAASGRASAEDAVRRARALGVVVIAGTDNDYLPGSRQIGAELLALAHAGLSPIEVLLAATSRAARCLAQETRLGAIMAGHEADLLVLDADPRTDVGRLGAPRMVLVSGRVAVDRR